MACLDPVSHEPDPTDHSPLNVMSPAYTFNEVHEFHKRIKCDIMLYPIFKDDWQYNSWYCNTYAIASVHGPEDVFNSHYSTIKTSLPLLWLEVKCFMFLSSVRIYKHQ